MNVIYVERRRSPRPSSASWPALQHSREAERPDAEMAQDWDNDPDWQEFLSLALHTETVEHVSDGEQAPEHHWKNRPVLLSY